MLSRILNSPVFHSRFLRALAGGVLFPVFALAGADAFDDLRREAEANNRFAWRAHALLAQDEPGAVVLSPFSIRHALGMAYAGARGQTEAEIASALEFAESPGAHDTLAGLTAHVFAQSPDEKVRIALGNAIWTQAGWPVKEAFRRTLEEVYAAESRVADFAFGDRDEIAADINAWVAQRTFDLIRDPLDPSLLNADTRLVLVNALALKMPFSKPFDAEKTLLRPFHAADGTTQSVPTMHQQIKTRYGANDFAEGIALPLAQGRFSLLLLLPRPHVTPSEVANSLAAGEWMVDDSFLSTKADVNVRLPRFEVREKVGLKDLFIDLGAGSMFAGADFSGISDDPLFVSSIVHEAYVQVVEEGVEAAAATIVLVGIVSVLPLPIIDFHVDRPFLFAIHEESTGTLLFTGQVDSPENPEFALKDIRAAYEDVLGQLVEPLGGGWGEVDSLGALYLEDFPWVYHGELGWLYLDGTQGAFWAWQGESLGWFWTALPEVFPFLYHADFAEWLYVDTATVPGWKVRQLADGSVFPHRGE